MAKSAASPTRMALLNTKQKLALSTKGHKLLKQKRDALILEFFDVVKQAKDLRTQADEACITAFKSLALSQAFHGKAFLENAARSAEKVPEIEVTAKNIMGLKIPRIKGVSIHRNILERGYGVAGTDAKFDETVANFENALNLIIKLAETEVALLRLLQEIEKTSRRTNALEYNIQPELRGTIKYITLYLNQLEAERFVGLKLMKTKMAKAEEAEELAQAAEKA
ncbi:V-type ATP synthase subunit D [Candidatus Micrarchaeota archaeon CG_4_10_14_0_2_um_filter_60_11]|nr:MAG: hypothetical protein AUJ16_02035 [Candidatus Micrarchaeota archaeon CG1_02_60_51]PIN96528.1 MAG: V-type ATP synthase subunit D [Candidatus Micrarchaeota archaeon CG10_big_fil_rev_8_21_14_0_10_60_32]PIO02254.1 MAG: V-type ATP synthase subunit D [Candidatus Micrarchaeota archaeon CG09_land_8_20_14_0_10_60_16]PIY91812.1 MAG: V-type ATP synthase subunit D [Candidatus Micrarchaeota archaeon CG_4_10_14_0_8_um_filter_60_7]PIZ91075.1 MAG: V-type ATP synthase subunit D [Candidatus Micrarchaeota 